MVGGPQNFYNLFSQFPQDSYIILTSSNGIDESSAAKGGVLPGKYILSCRKRDDAAGGAKPADPDASTSLRRRASDAVGRIPLVGGTLVDFTVLVKDVRGFLGSALRAAKSSGVRLILGISDTGPALLATYIVHKVTKIPYAVYLFDLYRGNNLRPFHRWVARIFERTLLRNAAVVILTNEETENRLRRRYGNSFRAEVIHNSAFPEKFDGFRTPFDPKPPYVILFTGNVYWAQEGAVLNLIQAMERLRDLPVRLDLYVPNASESIRKAAAGRSNIRLASAPQEDMPRIQCGATLLFLPLAWDTGAPDIIATASPGKMTDYLASGRPTLVHAPDYSYVVRRTRERGTGIVVDKDDVNALSDGIRRFLLEPAAGRNYVANGLGVFEQFHDARKNGRRLWKILRSAGER
jgi:glycosyltransferase involved in cell wall biosynthesis